MTSYKSKFTEEKHSGMSEEEFRNTVNEYLINTVDYLESMDGLEIQNDESVKSLLRKIFWDFIKDNQEEIYDSLKDKLEKERMETNSPE